MKTKYKIILIVLCILVVSYISIITVVAGSEDVINPVSILYFPSILMQLIANEGNGIICVDACGPCSAWGTYYMLIDGECVNGPDGRICSNDAGGKLWRFFDGKCAPFIEERVPYKFSIDYMNSKIASCSEMSEQDQVCNPPLQAYCPSVDDEVWNWADMYELCFKMKNQSIPAILDCSKITSKDTICNPEQNVHLCPNPNENLGWSYNNLDKLCYKWTYNGKDCSPLEILNRECFVNAFTKCTDARISKTEHTIEGDLIIISAFVNSTNPDECKVDVYRDMTQDRYSNQSVYHYSCSLIIDDGEILQIGECIPLEHGRSERFVFGK